MFHLLASILLVFMASIVKGAAMGEHTIRAADGCTLNGVVYPAGHTMCLPPATNMTPLKPSADDQQAIVDKHNEYRSGVDPVASDMMKMYWDANMAMVAQAWAETCPDKEEAPHDGNRKVPAYGIGIGQNGGFGTDSFEGAVNMWYKEVKNFIYGAAHLTDILHYTQVVSGKAIAVGCGGAYCPDRGYEYNIYCNYAFGQSGSSTPYQVDGDAGCTNTCGSHCVDNLCDCGDMLCKHGGSLDISTCTCTCPDIFDGDTCEIVKCPDAAGNPKVCENGGTFNVETCSCLCPSIFSGDTCQILNCPNTDPHCAQWNHIVPTPCNHMGPRNDCPFTCGLCERPCGRECKNGGTMDLTSCTCICPSLYQGDTCETINCPAEPENCWKWGNNQCQFLQPQLDCPYTCKLCP